jgi:hypothetical protein
MSGTGASCVRLVFSGGKWVEVDVGPFAADPAITGGQLFYAAAAAAAAATGGASREAAVQAAEKRLYRRVYGSDLDWVSGK